MTRTILTAEFSHETNAFSIHPADYAAFASRGLLTGDAAIAARGAANTGLAGFLDVAKDHGWTLKHTVSASAEPCGPVTRDAFDRIAGPIVEEARQHAGRLDGVLLALHGAMVTEDSDDGEGELLARLRDVLPPRLPVAITLDLHANVTARMCELTDIIVSYKTYPHIDMRIAARHAAEILRRTMDGEIAPRTVFVRLPMLDEANACRTDVGPMVGWVEQARAYEREPDVFAVSVNAGFPQADMREVGPTVLVTCQGDLARHRRFAHGIADDIWANRRNVVNRFYGVDEAAAIARDHDGGGRPIIVADYADNPGAGSYGDATELLRAMLAADLSGACFGPMVDPGAASLLHQHRVGDAVSLDLGGKTDPAFGGPPLPVTGTLTGLFDGWYTGDGPMIGGLRYSFGPTATMQVAGVAVLIVSAAAQMRDLQQFLAFGIDPRRMKVVGLKSMQHFRAAFEPIASRVIVCDSGALCTPDLSRLPYRNVPRPIFPLDADASWTADSGRAE